MYLLHNSGCCSVDVFITKVACALPPLPVDRELSYFVKYYLLTLVGYAVIDPRVERQRICLGTKIVSASFMPWHEFRGM